ncbi:MAG: hypothetical protein WBM69_08745 [Desulfobacterales bacterium]
MKLLQTWQPLAKPYSDKRSKQQVRVICMVARMSASLVLAQS